MSKEKRKRQNQDVKSDELSNANKERILRLFEKKFAYNNNFESDMGVDIFGLQSCSSKSSVGKWEIEDFMKMKSDMNMLKSSLNDKDLVKWHLHTKQIHHARKIINSITWNYRAEFCTQAWCKFYEIASNYLDIDSNMPYFSVHLCEAPGAFITSLNHYMFTAGYKGEWRWLATTLNPYYEGNNVGEMIEDDRFIQHTYDKWYFGVDGTGNLMSQHNMEGLKEMLGDIYVNLVTADGSIDCQGEPAEQESIVSQLHHCEALTALQILSPGGTFVLKMFTMYECASICLMYLLNRLFAEVHVFKPCCSKGGNSEVYVVCKNYKGRQFCDSYLDSLIPLYFDNNRPPVCLFDRSSIPDSFIEQHRKCVTFFWDNQRSSIRHNLDLDKELDDEERSMLNAEQDFCQKCFFEKYKVEPLQRQRKISKHRIRKRFPLPRTTKVEESFESNYSKRVKLDGRLTGSLTERKQNEELPWKQKVVTFETYEKELETEINFACWIKSSKSQLKTTDILDFEPMTGQTIPSIQSSRFCAGFLIAQAREIIQNVQWLKTRLELSQDAVLKTVKHIKEAILLQVDKDNSCDTIDSSNNELGSQTENNLSDIQTIKNHLNNNKTSCDTEDHRHDISDLSSETVSFANESNGPQGQDRWVTDEKNVDVDNSTHKAQEIINAKSFCDTSEPDHRHDISDLSTITVSSASEIDQPQEQDRHVIDEKSVDVDNSTHKAQEINAKSSCDTSEPDRHPNISDLSSKTVINANESDSSQGQDRCVTDEKSVDVDKSKHEAPDIISNKADPQSCQARNSQNVDSEQLKTNGHVKVLDGNNCDSQILKELTLQDLNKDMTSTVHFYSSVSYNIQLRYELIDQEKLLRTVLHILKSSVPGDLVVIEMGTCMTRFTAGLVYILYRSFEKIGFLHCHGNYLHCHLVCMSFLGCPIELQEYLQSITDLISSNQSEAVLEVLPILTLLTDEEFVTFLNSTNAHLLQSFITTVIHKERNIQSPSLIS